MFETGFAKLAISSVPSHHRQLLQVHSSKEPASTCATFASVRSGRRLELADASKAREQCKEREEHKNVRATDCLQ